MAIAARKATAHFDRGGAARRLRERAHHGPDDGISAGIAQGVGQARRRRNGDGAQVHLPWPDVSGRDHAGKARSVLRHHSHIVVALLEEQGRAATAEADRDLVAAHAAAIFDDGFSYVGGNPEGSVTVVEFLDYQCGFCRRAHPELTRLIEEGGDIRWIVKEMPILGPGSELAARAAIATLLAEGPEAYMTLHHRLMGLQGPIDDAFMDSFLIVRPTGKPQHAAVGAWCRGRTATLQRWSRARRCSKVASTQAPCPATDAMTTSPPKATIWRRTASMPTPRPETSLTPVNITQ